jgi:hypothetical protein
MRKIIFWCFSFLIATGASADEGMWMLNHLKASNWARMKELGFKMTPEQLYDTIQPSLKDAVVHFGGGCTGITVSDKGLIFTNHHCGYGAIQSKSTVEHDYLRDGFISETMADEIPIPGLTVTYLLKTIDVTKEVLAALDENTNENERSTQINDIARKLEYPYNNQEQSITAQVRGYFANTVFYLSVFETVTDVRLVFAPPSSLGKFGGETDNWMWPRHTCDFSVFRAYANPEKKKGYQEENVPYKPKYVVPVSLQGYQKGSYAMTIGFPGRTNRYLSSWGIEQRVKGQNEPRIEVRGVKQNIWKEAMLQSDKVRIEYASKYAGSSNYWKNSIGMNRGLERMHVVERKQALEKEFQNWVDAHPDKKNTYGTALQLLETAYTSTDELQRVSTYLGEVTAGVEIIRYAMTAASLDVKKPDINHFNDAILPSYKDYEPTLDEKVLPALFQILKEKIPAYLPDIFSEIDKKYKGDYTRYAADLFSESAIPNPEKLKEVLSNPKKAKKLQNDPAIRLAKSFGKIQGEIQNEISKFRNDIIRGERLFLTGLQEMKPEINFPADANSTMRMSYGSVDGYVPYDGAWYNYFTTTDGVFEKYKEGDSEFHIQPEIRSLLQKKDFGVYGTPEGKMHVNFLSNNDITGGNSGSPIFDEKGRLLGLAFDGNWEAMSGDIAFEPDVQKCIGVDVRYILFVIDKWGNCRRLLNELKIE